MSFRCIPGSAAAKVSPPAGLPRGELSGLGGSAEDCVHISKGVRVIFETICLESSKALRGLGRVHRLRQASLQILCTMPKARIRVKLLYPSLIGAGGFFGTGFGATPPRAAGGIQRRDVSLCFAMTQDDKLAVLVTGASGRTGKHVFKRLLDHPVFEGRGLVRSKKSLEKLKDLNIPKGRVSVADISKGPSSELDAAMKGIDAVIICTSAVPRMKSAPKEGKPPEFDFPEGQYPEQVDWLGQKAQIDAAKRAGANQVVIVSSMGGTDRNNNLNRLGGGNILINKRKAEQHLIAADFPSFTILHPGGLIDEKGGEREIVFGVDDGLMQETSRSIPREDVAELCVQSLSQSEAQNRSIDVITRQPGKGPPTTDFEALFAGFTANCTY